MTSQNSSFTEKQPVEILQKLIRFDTTNPPGNEGPCIEYIKGLFESAGVETKVFECRENRPNLVARIPGDNLSRPLLVQGHVDVVTADTQSWKHPPFEGRLADGFVWGRGALDMKGGVAMMISALLKIVEQGGKPPGDIVFAALSDEEAGGNCGAKFMAENHPEQFSGVRYAVGEFGGASMDFAGRRFYPVQVSEKQICWMQATLRGPGGHGSMPIQGGSMGKLGRLLCALDTKSLPVRITPVARQMIETMAQHARFPANFILKQLLNPLLTNLVLYLLGNRARILRPLLHNTVSPTIVNGGSKVNVIPSEIVLTLDGRLVPGSTPQELINEIRSLAGDSINIEITRHDPGPEKPDMSMFSLIEDVLKAADPEAVAVPLLMPGVTDARFFSKLGIQTYGFLPLKLPRGLDYFSLIHNANERVPADALEFGAGALLDLFLRHGSQDSA